MLNYINASLRIIIIRNDLDRVHPVGDVAVVDVAYLMFVSGRWFASFEVTVCDSDSIMMDAKICGLMAIETEY